jgi:hypothetical protein
LLTALTVTFLSLLAFAFAGPAAAGGPTSVLLVVPGEGRTASLYNSDPEYQQLADLVGAFNTPAGSTTPPKGADDQGASGTNDASGPGVTITWLMHDVNVWRVDRVYLNAEGGPLVSTQSTMNGGDLWSKPPVWHNESAQGKVLIALLDSLGVGNAGAGAPNAGGPAPVPQIPATAAADSAAADSTGTGSASDDGLLGSSGWLWGPVGLLIGIALTLAVLRWRNAARGSAENAGRTPTESEDTATEPALPSSVVHQLDLSPGKPSTETLSSH